MISFAPDQLLEIQIKMLALRLGASFVKKVIEETGGLAAYSVAVVQAGNRFNLYKADITIDGKVRSQV